MSQETQGPHGSPDPNQRHGFQLPHLPHWLTVGVLLVVIVYNLGEFFKTSGVTNLANDKSMFSVPTQIFDRIHSCDYKLLFFCELKSDAVLEACKDKIGLARSTAF